MKKFSERKGYKKVSDIIQKDGMSEELRNSLWNILDVCIWDDLEIRSSYHSDKIETYSINL